MSIVHSRRHKVAEWLKLVRIAGRNAPCCRPSELFSGINSANDTLHSIENFMV